MLSTLIQRIVKAKAEIGSNWRGLVLEKGEPTLGDKPVDGRILVTLIHLSDLHICDAASPVRLEFLDRLADPDNPLSALIPYVGTYRAQEFLTTHVLEAMVIATNEIEKGPLMGAKIDAVVITGDVTDNAQKNELDWYKKILDGGLVDPKSGDSIRSEASHSSNLSNYDIHYYHPDGPPPGAEPDRPSSLHGFPHFKGALKASESPFIASGLKHPWFAIHGNHDALLQGTAAPTPELDLLAKGSQKFTGLRDLSDLGELFQGFGEVGPAIYPALDYLLTKNISADSHRGLVSMSDWVEVNTNCAHDHGLDANFPEIAYWTRDLNSEVRLIALDTVNRFGGWQGCLDREQFAWLSQLLIESTGRYVVITSHHPIENLINNYAPEGVNTPVMENEVRELLSLFPNVVLWIAGHVHDHKITQHKKEDGSHSFWEIRTGSHIDWPQQSRTIEIVKCREGSIAIGTVVYDHAGPLEFTGTKEELNSPVALAGLSRLLASNDWQRQSGPYALSIAEGTPQDRNIWLFANDPFKLNEINIGSRRAAK